MKLRMIQIFVAWGMMVHMNSSPAQAQTVVWRQIMKPTPFLITNILPLSNGCVLASSGNLVARGDSGVFRSADNGDSWHQIVLSSPIYSMAALANGRIIAWGTGGEDYPLGLLFRSTDNGLDWDTIHCQVQWNPQEYNLVYKTIVSPDGFIYSGTSSSAGILRSTDDGETWEQINNGIYNYYLWWAIPIALTPSGLLFALTESGSSIFGDHSRALFKSSDQGESWSASNFPWAGATPWGYDFETIESDRNGRVYVSGLYDKYSSEGTPTFSRTSLDDMGWAAIKPPGAVYPSDWITCLRFDKRGCVLLGTNSSGFFLSNDSGATWVQNNTGLFTRHISTLAIDSLEYIYAATDSGIFKGRDSIIAGQPPTTPLPTQCSVFQNFPNPFNPSTTIKFELPRTSHVNLSVYDILGREVSVLVNESKQPGSYTVQFDGSNLASGLYFYQLKTGTFVETRKLLLIR